MFAELYDMKFNHSPKPLNPFKTMKKLALIAAGLMLSIGAAFAQDADIEKKRNQEEEGCHECGDSKIVPIKVQVDCVLKLDVEDGLKKFHFKPGDITSNASLQQTLGLIVTGNTAWNLYARLADADFEEIGGPKSFSALGKVAVDATGAGFTTLTLGNQLIGNGAAGSSSVPVDVKIGPIGLTDAEEGLYANAMIFDVTQQ